MTLISHDERLIKALAVAIVDRPRATLKELAEAAGVSKATLHRFCGTRD
ncbi:TPA: efflux pump transcriptional repressor NfxB, partial [Pseudomonas aeruginosa]|nr:efflux pump transcriptional repressor NfxB [Pseudomonas aeruginosa]HCE9540313.1 efflux pump transcriptional repressor NfxB [Pseudomonas aeruginosa]HCF3237608.1 efflux pump transcriptional repressor NfxB [Pseudomonas aeruginosa]HCF7327398.1 efflux pump transcriptional repressor NfxB [Pseudomonas aeruginosa]HCL3258075.1 efflux pump transcriptional repressor NfxB [Pseudomonas aeruginosa]